MDDPPMSLPIVFKAIYQERVWGGRKLESVYGRSLPEEETPYGESWEISDREHEQSVVKCGVLAGQTLNQLWSSKRSEIFGDDLVGERFPLLIKILDSRTDLSIQVHPPEQLAEELGGEPKTEMWYIADVEADSKLYVGLKNGVSKESFEQSLANGTVEQQVHAITPEVGDSIFIESGRLHAIGGGFLIYEIQQNSDTTYRVFDWNRVGLDGKPRDLHVEQSMNCIDFSDFEPSMDTPSGAQGNCISDCPYFYMEKLQLTAGASLGNPQPERFSIITVVSGNVSDTAGGSYKAGDFFILPRGADPLTVTGDATILQTVIPE